jgi:uncharacterized BrkB/YihY/UPF0761 family membrane protein
MMTAYRRRSVSLVPLVWLVVGVLVASNHHYFGSLSSLGGVLSAILAVLLWPLVLLGTNITINV